MICANPNCLKPVEDHIAHQTGGICWECAQNGVLEALRTVNLRVGGGLVPVSTARKPQSARNRRQHLRRKGSEAVKRRKHAAQKARTAAMKRLAAAAPELFALILADERQKRGLTPITVVGALQSPPGDQAWETLGALAFYRALSSPKDVPDAAEHPTQDAHPPRDEPERH